MNAMFIIIRYIIFDLIKYTNIISILFTVHTFIRLQYCKIFFSLHLLSYLLLRKEVVRSQSTLTSSMIYNNNNNIKKLKATVSHRN